MKKIKLSLLVAILFICFGNFGVKAETDPEMIKMTAENQEEYLSSIDFRLLLQQPKKQLIETFDVNENHWVAIGFKISDRGVIAVYDEKGSFQYGYSFICYGTFGIKWCADDIQIYFIRSSKAATFDKNGKMLEMYVMAETADNSIYLNRAIFATTKTVGDAQYKMKNKFAIFNVFSSSFSQIVCEDAAGNSNIIYNADGQSCSQLVVELITIVLVFAVAVGCLLIILIRQSKK